MPVQPCQQADKPGWKCGASGKCYTYDPSSDADNLAAKKSAIAQCIAEGEDPGHLSADDPQGVIPPEVNYREAAQIEFSCATCSFYANSYCSMFDAMVEPSMVCDEWSPIRSDQSVRAAAEKPKRQTLKQINAHLKAGTRRAMALEPGLVSELQQILDQYADKAARGFSQRATEHLTAATNPAEGEPPEWHPPAGDEVIDVAALVKTLRTKTDPVRLATIADVMGPVLAGSGIDFDITNPLAGRVLAQSGSQITNIAETTQLNAMRVIKASYEQGLSIPDTAKAIRAGMKEANVARATLIARTELVGVVNGASLAATQIVGDATGTSYSKEWLTSPGAQFPRHEDYDGLDGQKVSLDEPFNVGDSQLQFPGDPDGPPEEVCNCRCTMVYGDGQEVDADSGGIDTSSEGRL